MKILRPKSKQPIPKNAQRVFEGKLFDIYQGVAIVSRTCEKYQNLQIMI